jgi:hypothetical protein
MEGLNLENLEEVLPTKIWDPNLDPIEPNCNLFRELERAANCMYNFFGNSLLLKLSDIQKRQSQGISEFEAAIEGIYNHLKCYPSSSIKDKIFNTICSCHSSTVAASIRRRGNYWFDLKKVYYDALWKTLHNKFWESFDKAFRMEDQNLKITQTLLRHLYDCVQKASITEVSWKVIFDDHNLWTELQSEWGKRPKPDEPYRERVASRLTQKIGYFAQNSSRVAMEYENILQSWKDAVLKMWRTSMPVGPLPSSPGLKQDPAFIQSNQPGVIPLPLPNLSQLQPIVPNLPKLHPRHIHPLIHDPNAKKDNDPFPKK